MNIQTLTCGSAFTRDPDYYEFLGAPYERTIYDWSRRRWIRCMMQAPKTPKDVVKSDPDRQLEPEYFDLGPEREAQRQTRSTRRAEQKAEMQMTVTAYLLKYGPAHLQMMAADLDMAYTTLGDHIRSNEGQVYCRLGLAQRPVIWGLVSVHDQEETDG